MFAFCLVYIGRQKSKKPSRKNQIRSIERMLRKEVCMHSSF
jgi:hypothetical protein